MRRDVAAGSNHLDAFQTARASIRVPALSCKEPGLPFANAPGWLGIALRLLSRFALKDKILQHQLGKPILIVANQPVLAQ